MRTLTNYLICTCTLDPPGRRSGSPIVRRRSARIDEFLESMSCFVAVSQSIDESEEEAQDPPGRGEDDPPSQEPDSASESPSSPAPTTEAQVVNDSDQVVEDDDEPQEESSAVAEEEENVEQESESEGRGSAAKRQRAEFPDFAYLQAGRVAKLRKIDAEGNEWNVLANQEGKVKGNPRCSKRISAASGNIVDFEGIPTSFDKSEE